MIIHDPKKAAVMIIAGSEPSEEPQKEEDSEILDLCENLIHAVKTNDAHGVALAVKALFAECQGYSGEE